eukprot:jgi/Tetstr1/463973/TSEL_008778.t1
MPQGRRWIDRAAYEAWERAVVDRFWGEASARTKRKALVVCHAPDLAAAPTRHIRMHHIGKGEPDGVKVGTDADRGVVFHPATDTGGLTNYRHPATERPAFHGRPRLPDDVDGVYAEWKRMSGKARLYGGARDGLRRWLASCPPGSVVRFRRLPPEKRVIVPAADVLRATGAYMLRAFGQGDDRHAYGAPPGDVARLFCAVAPGFVTPNINRNNLINEYSKS